MAISKGINTATVDDLKNEVNDLQVAKYYLGINKIPILILSPLREDKHPSLGLQLVNNNVMYRDFSTGEKGSLYNLLSTIWGVSYGETLSRIGKDIPKIKQVGDVSIFEQHRVEGNSFYKTASSSLEVKTRNWETHDIEYWKSYGITKEWLDYAEIYPVSHKIIVKEGKRIVYKADKYAYVFVERKDNKPSLKVYQPYNQFGFKWHSDLDKSSWSFWTKIPEKGDTLIIASSLKDCLNISANTNIPAICMQGEGYLPKPQVIEELKCRYKNIIVFFDNDYDKENNPGRTASLKWSEEYDLMRMEIPKKYKVKDPSDLFKKYGKEKYQQIINEMLETTLKN